MKLIRWILGRIILVVDALTSPKPIARDPSVQKEIDQLTASMSMYQFTTCPFCVKVRRELKRHSLNIELRDAKNDAEIKEMLIDLLSDIKEMNHMNKIQFLEAKDVKNLDESSYSELIELKNQLNRE